MAAELGRVHITAEAIARGESGSGGAATTPAQSVRQHARSTLAGGAAQVVTLARELAKSGNSQVLAALTDGRIPVRSATAVLDETDRLRPLLADGAEAAVITGLIAMAEEHGPRGARMVRPRLLAQYGLPDQLQHDQDATTQFIALTQPRPHGPGIFEYLLTLDTEGHAVLEAALGPLAAPDPPTAPLSCAPATAAAATPSSSSCAAPSPLAKRYPPRPKPSCLSPWTTTSLPAG